MLEFQLELCLTEAEMNQTVIRTELNEKKRPAWQLIVVKIVIEMLANSTASTAVVKNLESTIRLTCPNIINEQLPCKDYVRKARGT